MIKLNCPVFLWAEKISHWKKILKLDWLDRCGIAWEPKFFFFFFFFFVLCVCVCVCVRVCVCVWARAHMCMGRGWRWACAWVGDGDGWGNPIKKKKARSCSQTWSLNWDKFMKENLLTLKVPSKIVADDMMTFWFFFRENTTPVLFSLKNKNEFLNVFYCICVWCFKD